MKTITTILKLTLITATLATTAITMTACIDDGSSSDPKVIRETGYLNCDLASDACDGGAFSCQTDTGETECVTPPGGCEALTCACLGEAICGDAACTISGNRIICGGANAGTNNSTDPDDLCAGLQCGDPCDACGTPLNPDCTEEAWSCNSEGQCVSGGDDQSCTSTFDPCGGLACGDPCSECDPNEPECTETAVEKACNSEGVCTADSPDLINCEDDTYEPCGDKVCGDSCTICDPSDPDCAETAVEKFCDAAGACRGNDPTCADGNPCEGLSCGDICDACGTPANPECTEAGVYACDDDNTCVPMTDEFQCTDDTYEPCGDKACGDSCSLCDPNDTECVEDASEKVCNAAGTCRAGTVTCTDTNPCEGLSCGDTCDLCGTPANPECLEVGVHACDDDNTCVPMTAEFQCTDDTYDPCDGKMCADTCTLCDPNDTECVEDASEKRCTILGACTADLAELACD